jgi:uroporphyrinogen-III synthase
MIPVIVIRPQPGCDATVAAARAQGLAAQGFALFVVEPAAWEPPAADSVDALLLGSANALRHAGPALAGWRGKPAYAVGRTTAEAARAAGLDVVATGRGGLQPVLDRVRPEHRRLLRLAGRERIALMPPPGVTMAERVVYASVPQPMPPALTALLAAGALVLLHSAEAARHFAGLCDRHAIPRARIALAAIGPRVAAAAGPGWAALATAAAPDDTALLALAGQMCQDPGRS